MVNRTSVISAKDQAWIRAHHVDVQRINKWKNVGNKFASLKTIIKNLYENANKQEDCPVCYECIAADKLTVPECGHFICSSCSVQCSRCPMCRDVEIGDYVEDDSNNWIGINGSVLAFWAIVQFIVFLLASEML